MKITIPIIGTLSIHRKEQWDLGVKPWLCIHVKTPDKSTRLACIWPFGLMLRLGTKRLVLSKPNSPTILNTGTRLLVFSGENQVTLRDMAMVDVAIVVKDRFGEPKGEKFNLNLLSGMLQYYYEQIKFSLHNL